MDATDDYQAQRALAGFARLAVLVFGLLVLWGIVAACDWLGLNQ